MAFTISSIRMTVEVASMSTVIAMLRIPSDPVNSITISATIAAASTGIVADAFTDYSQYSPLRDNDSYRALAAAGGLIVTGPTGTNVNDLTLILTDR